MSLRIKDISLFNFRSYDHLSLHDLSDLTILYGPNAIGKTNVIEAIQLLTALTSFRKATSRELIKQGEGSSSISSRNTDGNRVLDIKLTFSEGKRSYQLNGKPRSIKSLKGMLPSIKFSPEDLSLVKGSDSFRRQEVDLIGSQVNANYYQLTRDFEKILKHRNKLLKDEASDALLDSLTELFDKVGTQLGAYRKALLTHMAPPLTDAYERISGGEELKVEYISSWEKHGSLSEGLEETRAQERARKTTLMGPHRDHIAFQINDMDAGTYASQGQQRSIVLSMKIAEVQLIEEMMDQKPILLLDDVMSELDASRREAMVKELLPETQTFITTANLDYFDEEIIKKARIIDIEHERMGMKSG